MPRKNTPTKKSPGRKSNKSPASSPLTTEKGEITRWDSKGRDGRELAVYVEHGCCDALTAKYVREKFQRKKKRETKIQENARRHKVKMFDDKLQRQVKRIQEKHDRGDAITREFVILF